MRRSLSIKSITFLGLFLVLLLAASSAFAQTMSNDDYIIRMGNLNSISGRPTGSDYKLLYTVGQTGPGLYSGTNYKARAGFEYIKSIIPFRFQVSSTLIDFGTVSPTIPVLRTNQLTVSNGSAFGYQVTASQNHNLKHNTQAVEIPATACDSGTCTPTAAGGWSSSLAYGFGYRCDNVSGSDCQTQFGISSNYYKPFASSPSTSAVMVGTNVGTSKVVTITYKLNVSGSQATGTYTNIINYIATSTF